SSVVAEHGVRQRDLGTVTRNGVTQVTYFGKPLYGFVADKAANDVNGEDVSAFDGNWYLDQTDGLPAVLSPTVSTEISPNGIVLSSTTASGGRSLYLLTADTPKTSACGTAGGCVALWPPLLTSHRAVAGSGADRHLIGTVRRTDGTYQVTYAGRPLYFFALDLAAGATATLYAFSADTSAQSNCTGMCARIWPPVLTQSAPTASGAASGSLLGA